MLERFGAVGLTAAISGEITDDRRFMIEYGSDEEVLFNFNTHKITGIE